MDWISWWGLCWVADPWSPDSCSRYFRGEKFYLLFTYCIIKSLRPPWSNPRRAMVNAVWKYVTTCREIRRRLPKARLKWLSEMPRNSSNVPPFPKVKRSCLRTRGPFKASIGLGASLQHVWMNCKGVRMCQRVVTWDYYAQR